MSLAASTNPPLSVEIVGSGVVGRAVGKAFLQHNIPTHFIDINETTVQALQAEGLSASTVMEGPLASTVSMLCVPTPSNEDGAVLTFIRDAAITLGKRLAHTDHFHVVVVKSTVIPGTTETVVLPLLEKYSGKKAGVDFGVCFNPEYLREHTAQEDALTPRLIIIGEQDGRTGDIMTQLYESFDCMKARVPIKTAEFQKYVHNLFNAMKIAFFNEMRVVGHHWDVQGIEEIFSLTASSCEGIWNPVYGTKNLGAFAGSCLPKDLTAFLRAAQASHIDAFLAEAVLKQNTTYSLKTSQDI